MANRTSPIRKGREVPALQPLTMDEQCELNTAIGGAALDCWALIVERPKREPWISFLRENYRLLRGYTSRSKEAVKACEGILEFMREYKGSQACKDSTST